MATPIIQTVGSTSGAGTAGVSRTDGVLAETITFSNTEGTHSGQPHVWAIRDQPVGSSQSLVNPTSATPTLVLDGALSGSYFIRCTVNGVDISSIIVTVTTAVRGLVKPAWGEQLQMNEAGNTRGWMLALNDLVDVVDGIAGGGGNTLGGAYNEGGAGAGRAFSAINGAVAIDSAAADNNSILELTKNPVGAQSGYGLDVWMGPTTTGAGIIVNATGSGPAVTITAGAIRGPNGTAGAPTYAFTGMTNGGFYKSSASTLSISVSSTASCSFAASQLRIKAGSATTPGQGFTSDTNSGVYQPAADQVGITTGGTQAVYWNASQQTLVPNGTAALPSYAFATEPDCGFYVLTTDAIAVATGGTVRGSWNNVGQFTNLAAILTGAGTVGAVAFGLNTDFTTGMYSPGASQWAVSTGGTQAAYWDASQQLFNAGAIRGPNGSASTPTYSFTGDGNTGMYWISSDFIGFAAAGTVQWSMRGSTGIFTSLGGVHVATSTAAAPTLATNTDTNTGMFSDTNDTWAVTTGGTEATRWNASQQTLVPNGSAAAPSYSFASYTNMGIYAVGASQLGIAVSGAVWFTVQSSRTLQPPGIVTSPCATIADGNTGYYWPAADNFAVTTGGTQAAYWDADQCTYLKDELVVTQTASAVATMQELASFTAAAHTAVNFSGAGEGGGISLDINVDLSRTLTVVNANGNYAGVGITGPTITSSAGATSIDEEVVGLFVVAPTEGTDVDFDGTYGAFAYGGVGGMLIFEGPKATTSDKVFPMLLLQGLPKSTVASGNDPLMSVKPGNWEWDTKPTSGWSSTYFENATYTSNTVLQTVAQMSTVRIEGAPIASTNLTITEAMALHVQAGLTRLDGGLAYKGQAYDDNGYVVLTDGATVLVDCDDGNFQQLTMTATATRQIDTPSNAKTTGCYTFRIVQHSTATLLTWHADYLWPGTTPPPASTTVSSVTLYSGVWNGSKMEMVSLGSEDIA